MSFTRHIGEFVGQARGYFNIIGRSQPAEYRQIMSMFATIFVFILNNLIINYNIKKNKIDLNNNININNIFAQRLMALPLSFIIGHIIGYVAEIGVFAKLAESKQTCRYRGYVDNTQPFEQCVENINHDLQIRDDLASMIRLNN